MSFSGVSILFWSNLSSDVCPTPGMSFKTLSCSGREMNVLNFLEVVLVAILMMRNSYIFICGCKGFIVFIFYTKISSDPLPFAPKHVCEVRLLIQ